MKKVTYVQGDDWEGVYLDGELALEGHHVDFRDILHKLGISVLTLPADCDWLHKVGRLPDKISDVKVDNDR